MMQKLRISDLHGGDCVEIFYKIGTCMGSFSAQLRIRETDSLEAEFIAPGSGLALRTALSEEEAADLEVILRLAGLIPTDLDSP